MSKKELKKEPVSKTPVEVEVQSDVVVEEVPSEEPGEEAPKKVVVENWTPRTEIGRQVRAGEITNLDELFDNGIRIFETEIIDTLLPEVETDLLLIGQSKGKFGGGQRRVFRQTQKKTAEGNKPQFATISVAGNKNGYVGIGYGKSKETVPAREKAVRNAKLNIFKIRRGNWQGGKADAHTIPFTVTGKCGSVELTLMPAPRGKGLIVESECQKILQLAGIKDVWSRTRGQTGTKVNLIKACEAALRQLMEFKVSAQQIEELNIVEGKL